MMETNPRGLLQNPMKHEKLKGKILQKGDLYVMKTDSTMLMLSIRLDATTTFQYSPRSGFALRDNMVAIGSSKHFRKADK